MINIIKLLKKNKHKKAKEARENEQKRILSEVFQGGGIILNGPFKGMKYISDSHGSTLLPKVLGSYEEPIQDWIDIVINNKPYKKIIDIGCAEGYYACGFAKFKPSAQILAYDISPAAQILTRKLSEENGIKNITVGGECSHEELNRISDEGTLVFCDIEGGEKYLLLPDQIPNLKKVDLIIESHDCIIPNITEELILRFKKTHNIKIVIDYPNRVKEYNLPKEVTENELNLIFDERRSKHMRFLYLQSKNND